MTDKLYNGYVDVLGDLPIPGAAGKCIRQGTYLLKPTESMLGIFGYTLNTWSFSREHIQDHWDKGNIRISRN